MSVLQFVCLRKNVSVFVNISLRSFRLLYIATFFAPLTVVYFIRFFFLTLRFRTSIQRTIFRAYFLSSPVEQKKFFGLCFGTRMPTPDCVFALTLNSRRHYTTTYNTNLTTHSCVPRWFFLLQFVYTHQKIILLFHCSSHLQAPLLFRVFILCVGCFFRVYRAFHPAIQNILVYRTRRHFSPFGFLLLFHSLRIYTEYGDNKCFLLTDKVDRVLLKKYPGF